MKVLSESFNSDKLNVIQNRSAHQVNAATGTENFLQLFQIAVKL